MGFIPCKAEQPLRGMEFQGKEAQKDYSIQGICLERTSAKRCLLILDLKSLRSLVKGKHSIGRTFQSLAVRGKLLT